MHNSRSNSFKPSRFVALTHGLTTLEFSLAASGIALALGVFLVPMFDRASDAQIIRSASNAGIDRTVTGSVRSDPLARAPEGQQVRYIFRSVLHGKDQPPCIAFTNGTDNGHC
ncbi:MAG: hypothetical protein AAF737_02375 [Pseudomonadota bacterium]